MGTGRAGRPPPRRSATERREELVRPRCTWHSATPASLAVPLPHVRRPGRASVFFRAALTSPPHIKMVVSRDGCEAAQRCFITVDPPSSGSVFCMPLVAASLEPHSRALWRSLAQFFAIQGPRKHHRRMCPPAVESNLLFRTGLLLRCSELRGLPRLAWMQRGRTNKK